MKSSSKSKKIDEDQLRMAVILAHNSDLPYDQQEEFIDKYADKLTVILQNEIDLNPEYQEELQEYTDEELFNALEEARSKGLTIEYTKPKQ